jgi:hypothetical protein
MTAVKWLINEHFGGVENCTPDFKHKIEIAKELDKQNLLSFGSKVAMKARSSESGWSIEQLYNEMFEK